MPTPSIQTLTTDAQQVLNLDSISAVRSVVAVALANANTGTPLNPNLTTQQLWDQFYQVVTRPKSDIESIIANQLMKFLYSPPAPGGAGADKQVIFNDGGVLAGDADFLWNKTTNLLTVTGSATITGDLTVDTSTLKVDSANNRVGIGTASPSSVLTLKNPAVSGEQTILNIQNGTGVTSITKLTYNQDTDALRLINETAYSGATLQLGVNGTDLTIDQSGNVGLGVTPSAWGLGSSGYRAFEIGAIGNSIFSATNDLNISSNAYYLAGWKYGASSYASQYSQGSGKHIWYTASSGTAGNAITFTQAMTLDASGNLLIAKTAVSQTTLGFMAEAAGTVTSTLASSTTGSTFNVYSTGAAAYRFYVGMNGTISATNTTISAISDARLKENVQDIDVGLGAILALKPRKFDWKAGKGKDIKGDRGFIAQEFEQVFPQLVDEWKDAAPEGEAPYKSVRQDLIPVLVKAIQELTARVQTLEAK